MRKFWNKNKYDIIFTLGIFSVWRLFLFLSQLFSTTIPLNPEFGHGPLWQNFDGYHYQYIAHHGYGQFEQAFFPLFPLTLSLLEKIFPLPSMYAGLVLESIFLLLGLFVFIKLLRFDFSIQTSRWIVGFFLFFVTGFFLGSVYTESLFLLLVFTSLYFSRKNKFFLASVCAGLASATRLVGVFLVVAILIEYFIYLHKFHERVYRKENILRICMIVTLSVSGLVSYMVFLWKAYGDPLLFVHTLGSFNTGRTTSSIVLLPQVIFRYIKIFLHTPVWTHNFLLAFLELAVTLLFLGVLVIFWKKVRLSYLAFSILALLLPTISGTLTSMPRYALVAFPLFGIVGAVESKTAKIMLLVVSATLLFILCAFFLRGYFIA